MGDQLNSGFGLSSSSCDDSLMRKWDIVEHHVYTGGIHGAGCLEWVWVEGVPATPSVEVLLGLLRDCMTPEGAPFDPAVGDESFAFESEPGYYDIYARQGRTLMRFDVLSTTPLLTREDASAVAQIAIDKLP